MIDRERGIDLRLVASLAAPPEGVATAQLVIEVAECARLAPRVARRLVAAALSSGAVALADRGRRIVASPRPDRRRGA